MKLTMCLGLGFPAAALLLFALSGCGGGGSRAGDSQVQTDSGPDAGVTDAGELPTDGGLPNDGDTAQNTPEAPLFSEEYPARKAEYLQACFDGSGPDSGGLYGQVCRIALGDSGVNAEEITSACAKVTSREDTSDFKVAALVRLLYLDRKTSALPQDLRQLITETLLAFKYWIDEPGKDKMCYFSENHQILFLSGELLAGQLFPEQVFGNNGMTGAQRIEHARPRILRWLDLRARFGFSEWHSNVYFNEDMPALINLVDFAEDPEIRIRATMVLDLMAFDFLSNYFKGNFATVHGRTYPSKLLDGLKDSTAEIAWLMVGLGAYSSVTNFSAAFLATSDYSTPQVLEAAARASEAEFEHRQRDGWNVADGPDIGVGYTGLDDFVVWAGMAALAAPQVVVGTLNVVDEFDLWEGFLFGDLPSDIRDLVIAMMGDPSAVQQLARDLEPVSRGIALEAMNTYVFRTPYYQLAGGQDYNPGLWGTQTQMWQATLDREAFVFTSCPGGGANSEMEVQVASGWIGGWHPRVTLFKNVGVIQYRVSQVPMLGDYLNEDYLHAYFPREGFDEFSEEGNWFFGRKGDAYLALGSRNPAVFSEDPSYELRVEGLENTWVVELSSREEAGSFQDFVQAIKAAPLTFGDKVSYMSPSRGLVEVGWEGPMTVDGVEVDLGPHSRWDNTFSKTEEGSRVTKISAEGEVLVLDFEQGLRYRESGITR